jgi:glycosyltransferase involved in cell wall biosynthesis
MPAFFLEDAPVTDDPIDLIPRPRIGYLGNVFSLLDFKMLESIFARRSEWQLLFVGPIQSEDLVRGLRTLPNVHFAGPRPHESLPGILARFDVGLIPIALNEFTRPLTPLKFFEYLGAGVPMVSTSFDELERFRDLVRLVPNEPEAFEAAIERTLAEDRTVLSKRLREEAEAHTWTVINREHVIPVLRECFDF